MTASGRFLPDVNTIFKSINRLCLAWKRPPDLGIRKSRFERRVPSLKPPLGHVDAGLPLPTHIGRSRMVGNATVARMILLLLSTLVGMRAIRTTLR
jgi:hypothetical protein